MIDEMVNKINELKNQLQQEVRALLNKEIMEIFDSDMELKSIAFQAYTPYFNDGDTCYYGVRCDEPIINGTIDAYEVDWDEYKSWVNRDSVQRFIDLIYKIENCGEDICKTIFGDHVEVTFARTEDDLINMTTEYYEHD